LILSVKVYAFVDVRNLQSLLESEHQIYCKHYASLEKQKDDYALLIQALFYLTLIKLGLLTLESRVR